MLPSSLRQRCLVHKMRNLLGKLPEVVVAEFRQAAKAAYQAPSPTMAEVLRQDLVDRYAKDHPTAVRCFEEDFDACIAHLRCPPAHRRVIRTTNLLERLFGEERRRTKAIWTFFGERALLKLMYASVVRASDTWRGLNINDFERAQLKELRQQLGKQHRQDNAPAVESSTPDHVCSTNKT